MRDVEQALSQIEDIRAQLASSTRFHGFAPQAVAMTGVLAFTTALAQSAWPERLAGDPPRFVLVWTIVAVLCSGLLAIEGAARAVRLHGAMANMMIAGTLKQLLPFGLAGGVITLLLFRSAPSSLWLLPGLWQILIALIGFTSLASLPKAIAWTAAWYFTCGIVVLAMTSRGAPLSPWMMGIPFSLGQAAIAIILHRDAEGRRDRL